jgi:hypothetical protein
MHYNTHDICIKYLRQAGAFVMSTVRDSNAIGFYSSRENQNFINYNYFYCCGHTHMGAPATRKNNIDDNVLVT